MNVQLPVQLDKSAFLAWVQGQEGRYELADRRVVMMTGGSRGHALITRRLAAALDRRIDSQRWIVLTSDFGVDIDANTIRYPDVVVDLTGGHLKDLTATAPVLVAEVTSPSSIQYDLGDKASEYLSLPSLLNYLVLAHDQPQVWTWFKTTKGISQKPTISKGLNAVVQIAALGIELPLSEIYAGFDAG